MLTPLLLMIVLSWVAPIVAPFETILDTLKIFSTDWGTYRTSVSFTVCPYWSFMFTETFRSYFIYWKFPTVTLMLYFSTSVISFFLWVICDDALISPNHYSGSSLSFSFWTSPQIFSPTNRLLTSPSFSFPLFAQQSAALWPLLPQLLHSLLKWGFISVLFLFLFSFLFPQQFDALWTYLPHLLHSPLKDLLLLFLHFFSLEFNARNLYSGSSFYHMFLPFSSVFQNQHISFFRSLKCI